MRDTDYCKFDCYEKIVNLESFFKHLLENQD